MAAPSLTYGGVDMSAHGLVLEGLPEIGPAARRIDVQSVGFAAGGISQGAFDEPRVIRTTVRAVGADVEAMRGVVKGWWAALVRDTPAALSFPDSPGYDDRYWLAQLSNAPALSRVGTIGRAELEWLCADPWAYGAEEVVEEIEDLSAEDELSIAYDGDAWAWPVHEITIGAGGASSVTLSNAASLESFAWSGSLSEGDKLRLDAARDFVEKWNGAAWVTAMSGWSVGSAIPRLRPGTTPGGWLANVLTVGGVAAGSYEVTYRDRWRG